MIPTLDERRLSNSRKLITELYGRIAALESENRDLRDLHRPYPTDPTEKQSEETTGTEAELGVTDVEVTESDNADNMISRLCGGQRQLNSDRAGRLRFFGPTSSLHLSESVTSSLLIREPNPSRGRFQWQSTVSPELQNHLLELYWKFQHQVLPIIHKEGPRSTSLESSEATPC